MPLPPTRREVLAGEAENLHAAARRMPTPDSRRLRRDEARNEMPGNLGRTWSRENPAQFRQFLDQISLNRAASRRAARLE